MQSSTQPAITLVSGRLTLSILLGSLVLSPIPAWSANLPAVTPAPTVLSEDGDGYVLGAGDRLRVEFFSVPEFSGEYPILPNGTINFPQVGAISVQGRTLKQASEVISARFRPFLTRPIVTLSLIAARPINIALSGEVNRPGTYTISALSAGGDAGVPNLTKTLQLAEGVTQAADLERVQIRRRIPNTPNLMQTVTVNLWQLLRQGDIRQDLRLQDGDSIFIPTTTQISLEDARQLSSTTIAAKRNRPIKIVVAGEVNRPGPYTLADNLNPSNEQKSGIGSLVPSVTQGIQIAGGITQAADIRNIKVRRLTATGEERVANIDFLKLLKSGDVRQDLPLQDGDTIEIPTATSISDGEVTAIAAASFSPDRITVNIVGEVQRPGAVAIPPNSPLNQAVLSAGGFNSRAKKSTVTLIRLNPNGTVVKRDITINLAQGVNEQNNPALRNNDTVIVRRSGLAGVTDALNAVVSPFSGVLGIIRLLGGF
jgi:polysaccharide biosynthesis/export protein